MGGKRRSATNPFRMCSQGLKALATGNCRSATDALSMGHALTSWPLGNALAGVKLCFSGRSPPHGSDLSSTIPPPPPKRSFAAAWPIPKALRSLWERDGRRALRSDMGQRPLKTSPPRDDEKRWAVGPRYFFLSGGGEHDSPSCNTLDVAILISLLLPPLRLCAFEFPPFASFVPQASAFTNPSRTA